MDNYPYPAHSLGDAIDDSYATTLQVGNGYPRQTEELSAAAYPTELLSAHPDGSQWQHPYPYSLERIPFVDDPPPPLEDSWSHTSHPRYTASIYPHQTAPPYRTATEDISCFTRVPSAEVPHSCPFTNGQLPACPPQGNLHRAASDSFVNQSSTPSEDSRLAPFSRWPESPLSSNFETASPPPVIAEKERPAGASPTTGDLPSLGEWSLAQHDESYEGRYKCVASVADLPRDKKGKARQRRRWNHIFEDGLFTTGEQTTLTPRERRKIYIASLECYIDELQRQLDEKRLELVPKQRLDSLEGLTPKSAKMVIAGLQHDIGALQVMLQDIEEQTSKFKNPTIATPTGRAGPLDAALSVRLGSETS